ncbi:unnamed protein product [Prorocentrum cordatum]|uniref:Uncharacterized protein n=1 Tax=Prorocentrum cordatum TaxID=2364126 RepID=A0ABN9TPM6_9DINO|nr:unnamed protein product [Polarella glacialis]
MPSLTRGLTELEQHLQQVKAEVLAGRRGPQSSQCPQRPPGHEGPAGASRAAALLEARGHGAETPLAGLPSSQRVQQEVGSGSPVGWGESLEHLRRELSPDAPRHGEGAQIDGLKQALGKAEEHSAELLGERAAATEALQQELVLARQAQRFEEDSLALGASVEHLRHELQVSRDAQRHGEGALASQAEEIRDLKQSLGKAEEHSAELLGEKFAATEALQQGLMLARQAHQFEEDSLALGASLEHLRHELQVSRDAQRHGERALASQAEEIRDLKQAFGKAEEHSAELLSERAAATEALQQGLMLARQAQQFLTKTPSL